MLGRVFAIIPRPKFLGYVAFRHDGKPPLLADSRPAHQAAGVDPYV